MLNQLVTFLARALPAPRGGWPKSFVRWPPAAAASRWLATQSPWWRHVFGNLGVGLGIALGLALLHDSAWLREAEDQAVDWMLQIKRATVPAKPGFGYALLDIDEDTYWHPAWGGPLHVPRDKLRLLIQAAVDGRASLIIVDVDLTRPGLFPGADAALAQFLATYSGAGRPPIILPLHFQVAGPPAAPASPRLRPSFLDRPLAAVTPAPRVFWGSPRFDVDETDLRLRRWRLWEQVERADSGTTVVPSIELLAVAVLKHPELEPRLVVDLLQQRLDCLIPERAMDPTTACRRPEQPLRVGDLRLDAPGDAVAQRILYSLPWRLEPGERYPAVRLADGTQGPAFTRRPAWSITENDGQPVDHSWMAGRVVLIGGSYADGRDFHATPIGRMPGALVILNAVESLARHGQIHRPPLAATLAIEVLLIIMMSVVFAWVDSFWGALISGALIVTLLLPLSFAVFEYGVWLDFAIPLVAVQLHQMASSYEAMRRQRHHARKGDAVPGP